jgi:hypothetical protein
MIEDEFTLYKKKPSEQYNTINTPKVFIGCIIRSEYDEKRIKIKDNLYPVRVIHNNYNLYGLLFDPKPEIQNVINVIEKYNDIDLYTYNKILKENNFSCNDNFKFLEKDLYPLDFSNVYNYINDFKYNDFFDENMQYPLHQRIKSINVLILNVL